VVPQGQKGGNEKTGPLPLHPMLTGDILDGAIKLLRANARTLVILIATFMVPCEFLLSFFERNLNGGRGFLEVLRDPTASASQNDPGATVAIAVFAYMIFWLVVPLVCAGASRVVMASYLGTEMKPRAALAAAFNHAPAIVVATLIVHLAELVSVLGLIVGAAFVMPLFIMTAPAISLEDLGPFAGIRRSVSLVRRRYWPTVGIALLSGLLAYFLNQVLGLVPTLISLFIGLRWGWLIVGASGVLQSFVTVSLITIVATLVYLDARIRQEGFDIEVMAALTENR
jgi:hypothetical protein